MFITYCLASLLADVGAEFWLGASTLWRDQSLVLSFEPHRNGEFESPKGRDGRWEL